MLATTSRSRIEQIEVADHEVEQDPVAKRKIICHRTAVEQPPPAAARRHDRVARHAVMIL